MPDIDIDENLIVESVRAAFGNSIADPRLMRLGHPVTGAVKVPRDERLRPGDVWVHSLSEDDDQATRVSNSGPNKLRDDQLLYNTFVWIKPFRGGWIIAGEAPESAEFMDDVVVRPQRSIAAAQLDMGLLQPTQPASMKCIVSGATYVLDGLQYKVPNLLSDSFTSYVPGAGLARAVLVEIDPTVPQLLYTSGSTFDEDLSHDDAFETYYPKTIEAARFSKGYVKVFNGMTEISIEDILAAQEFFGKVAASDDIYPLVITGWF